MKAIIFDFDGTLANTLPVNYAGFKHVFQEFDNKSLSDEEVKNLFGPPEPEIIKKHLNSDQVEKAIEYYYKVYETHHSHLVNRNKDIEDMLFKLKNHRMKLGVVTGKSSRSFETSLEILKMTSLFDVMITGDDTEYDKPNPEGIFKALSKMDMKSDQSMYIGDSDGDIHAGRRANVTTAGAKWLPEYQSSEYTTEPDAVFTHPSDLLHFLKQTQ
ncbi:HAD family hydrolase [Alteribacillus sp. YIM 98480]|uniref:HAD family hydrolase n=1 Tax=Alteribacillus sp. YIM 98480 TaxID=2606599 RepID=UPI00131C5FFE|nr:HAD family hydrolase [Alteribacillus sp. YIM 98480]